MPDTPPGDELPGLEPDPDEALPGLEPGEAAGPGVNSADEPFELPEIADVEPTTYDGLTNAELDEWLVQEFGDNERFVERFRDELARLDGESGTHRAADIDPDLAAALRAFLDLGDPGIWAEWWFLDRGWKEFLRRMPVESDVFRLGPDAKARLRRYVEANRQEKRPTRSGRGTGRRLAVVGGIGIVIVSGVWLLARGPDSPGGAEPQTPAVSDVPTRSDPPESTGESVTTVAGTTTAPSAPSTTAPAAASTTVATALPPGGDAIGDNDASGAGSGDVAVAAAADAVRTAYGFDGGVHVFHLEVAGDGAALAASDDVRWYDVRTVMTTASGEVSVDLDATDGTARVFDDASRLVADTEVEAVWISPEKLRVTARIPGFADTADDVRAELTVRMTDGTDLADDAIDPLRSLDL